MGLSMTNGNLLAMVRLGASTLVTLACVVTSGLLMWRELEVSFYFWLIAILAMGGIVGEKVVSAVFSGLEAHRVGKP